MKNYTRWRENLPVQTDGSGHRYLVADILGAPYELHAHPATGTVDLDLRTDTYSISFSPDEARMLGVRLIEAAALADGERAIRRVAD